MKLQLLLGSIDLGTTSVRMILFDAINHQIVYRHQREFDSHYPHPGWCEQDPMVIMDCVRECMKECEAWLVGSSGTIECIGVTNQRETVVAWDRRSGKPLHPAIVWMDTRTHQVVTEMTEKWGGSRTAYQHLCGLPISTYFSAPKLRWLLQNSCAVQQAVSDGHLLVGTIDTWVLWNLTGGRVHVTDVSNASRTMLMDLQKCRWSEEMCEQFELPPSILPSIRPSAEVYGTVDSGWPFSSIPLSGCLGDQQSALVGQQCFRVGDAKNTYGTGCFMLYNTGTVPVQSSNGLLTTVGYQLGKEAKVIYALEGSVAIAGAAVKWLRDGLGLIKESAECSQLAEQVSDTGDVYFVPAFSGLFAPHWREDARGVLVGLTQFTTKHHICRAALEAVCFQTRDILESMRADSAGVAMTMTDGNHDDISLSDQSTTVLKVDGGMCVSELLMQLQADLADITVQRPAMQETTALGAAIAAAVGTGLYRLADEGYLVPGPNWPSDRGQPEKFYSADNSFYSPLITSKERNQRHQRWRLAIEKSVGWINY